MKLRTLKTENFQETASREMNFGGAKIVSIYGANKAGKTRTANAISWLLYGRDSHGNAVFDIKPLVDGSPEHNLDHSVDGVFELGDGQTVTLTKIYKEKWTAKRGQSRKELTSHTTDHFIDGVAKSEKAFKERVTDMVGDDETFKLLSDPFYFPEGMKDKPKNPAWMQRRTILMNIVPTKPTDEMIVLRNPDLANLLSIPEIKAGRSFDDHRETVSASMTKINKEIDLIPVKVKENERNRVPVDGLDMEELEKKIALILVDIEEKKATISRLKGSGADGERAKQLAIANAAVISARSAFNEAEDKRISGIRTAIRALEDKKSPLERKVMAIQADINTKTAKIKSNSESMSILRSQIDGLNHAKKDWFPQPGLRCDKCTVETPIEIQKSVFMTLISRSYEVLTESGTMMKAENDSLAAEITEAEINIGTINKEIQEIAEKISAERKSLEAKAIIESDEKYKIAIANVKKTEEEIASAKDAKDGFVSDIITIAETELRELEEKKSDTEKSMSLFTTNEKVQARTADLKAEQKKLASLYEDLENQKDMIDAFVRTKAEMLEEELSTMFDGVKFRLAKEQVNGGVADCCDVLDGDGIPFGTALNSSARINVGIKIINGLSKYMFGGLTVPIVVDNCESVSVLEDTDSQLIRLVVSAEDKILRIVI